MQSVGEYCSPGHNHFLKVKNTYSSVFVLEFELVYKPRKIFKIANSGDEEFSLLLLFFGLGASFP